MLSATFSRLPGPSDQATWLWRRTIVTRPPSPVTIASSPATTSPTASVRFAPSRTAVTGPVASVTSPAGAPGTTAGPPLLAAPLWQPAAAATAITVAAIRTRRPRTIISFIVRAIAGQGLARYGATLNTSRTRSVHAALAAGNRILRT